MHRFHPGPSYDSARNLVASDSFRGKPSTCIEGIGRQHLADVLTIKDCFTNRTMHGAPLLLRLEHDDVVVTAAENGGLSVWRGVVDTSARIEMFSHDSPCAQDNDRFCLAWIPVVEAKGAIGQVISSISLDGRPCDKSGALDFRPSAPVAGIRESSVAHRNVGRTKPPAGRIARIDTEHEAATAAVLSIVLEESALRIECRSGKVAIALCETAS